MDIYLCQHYNHSMECNSNIVSMQWTIPPFQKLVLAIFAPQRQSILNSTAFLFTLLNRIELFKNIVWKYWVIEKWKKNTWLTSSLKTFHCMHVWLWHICNRIYLTIIWTTYICNYLTMHWLGLAYTKEQRKGTTLS